MDGMARQSTLIVMAMAISLSAALVLEHTHRSALSFYLHMADIINQTPIMGVDGDSSTLKLVMN